MLVHIPHSQSLRARRRVGALQLGLLYHMPQGPLRSNAGATLSALRARHRHTTRPWIPGSSDALQATVTTGVPAEQRRWLLHDIEAHRTLRIRRHPVNIRVRTAAVNNHGILQGWDDVQVCSHVRERMTPNKMHARTGLHVELVTRRPGTEGSVVGIPAGATTDR